MLKFLQLKIFFLCLLLPVIFTANPCTNIPLFLNRLRDGVDITKLDLLPLSLVSNDGFRNPVIDYTCDFNITRKLDGIVYSIPDQVWSIVDIPSGLLDTRVEIHKNSHSFKRSLAAKVDIGISKGLFSASFTYKKVKSYFSSASKYVEDLTSHTAGYKVNMMPEWGLEFGRFAKMYIEKFLPKNLTDTTISKYMRFIETFGTHYFKQGRFGGILRLFLATDKNYFRKGSDKKVEMEAKATFKKFLSIGGKFSMSTEKVDSKFAEATRKFVRYYGGKTNLLADEGISKWQPTVLHNPWLYGGGLVEISRMIEDVTKSQSMKRAVQVYTDKAYLAELLREFKTRFMRTFGSVYMRHRNLLDDVKMMQIENEAKELLQKPLPIHDEVTTLGRMISPPPDWVKEIQLCFQWTYIDHASQKCDEGTKRPICSKYWYSNKLNNPNLDCPVQWGIFSVGYEKWFENFGICFRWKNYKKSENGNCGAGQNETVCGQLNSFVSVLFSNKGDADCKMEWIVSLPKEAPVWLQSTTIFIRYICQSIKRISRKTLKTYRYLIADGSQYRAVVPNAYIYVKGYRYLCLMESCGITNHYAAYYRNLLLIN